MHPKALLDACTELTRLLLRFDHPADSVVSKYFRDQRKQMALGPRERGVLAETGYNVLRQKLRFEHLAKSGTDRDRDGAQDKFRHHQHTKRFP